MSKFNGFSKNGSNPSSKTKKSTGHKEIFVGGTGLVIAQELAKNPRLKEIVNPGYIDTDLEGLKDVNPRHQYALTNLPLRALVNEIQANPHLYPGYEAVGDLDQLKNRLPAGAYDNRGAIMGLRQGAMLMFLGHVWRNFNLILAFLLGLIQDLIGMADPDEPTSNSSSREPVVITFFASVCGGTGSALVIMLADVLRYLANHMLGVRRVEYVAHLVLPSPFIGRVANLQLLMAKTYGFLIELLARCERDWPNIRVGSLGINKEQRPFRHMYLHDTVNRQEEQLRTREALAQRIAHIWEYTTQGAVADRLESLLVHVPFDYPHLFSAAGIAGLEYPVQRIQQQAAYRTGRSVLAQRLAPHPDAKAQSQAWLADFLHSRPDFQTLPAMRSGQDGKALLPTLQEFKLTVAKIPRQQLLSSIEKVCQHIITQSQPQFEALVERETQLLSRQLAEEVMTLLNRAHGIHATGHFLKQIDAHLADHQSLLARRLGQGDKNLAELVQVAEQLSEQWIKKVSLQAKPAHLSASYETLAQMITLKRLQAQYQLVANLREHVAAHLNRISGMTQSILELNLRLSAAEDEFISLGREQTAVVFKSVVTENEIDALIEARIAEISQRANQGLRFEHDEAGQLKLVYTIHHPGSLDSWQLTSPVGLTKHLDYCAHFWDYLARECSVEGHLRSKGVNLQHLLLELEHQAAPWVTINEAKQIPSEGQIIIVGTETGSQFLPDVPTTLNVVATGNKTRLVFLSTIHGFDVMNLQQIPLWREAYQQQLAQGESVHVMPEVDPLAADRKNYQSTTNQEEKHVAI